jgi:hypothetical protein
VISTQKVTLINLILFFKKEKAHMESLSLFLSFSLSHTHPQVALHLKMEDASVVFLEALTLRYHTVQQFGARGEGANGSQQPAVP